MTQIEKNEISQLPEDVRPVGAWTYFGLNLLFALPVVGFICMIVFAIISKNINIKNYARAYLIVFIIVLVLMISAVMLIGVDVFLNLLNQ